MNVKRIEDVQGGEIFLAIHPEEKEIRAWVRIWPTEPYNPEIACGESQFGYAGKKKYIKLPRFSCVVV